MTVLGAKFTQEHIDNLSKSHRGNRMSNKTKHKISLSQKGRVSRKEARVKLSLYRLGRKHTEETKQKMRDKRKNQIITEETRIKISKALSGERGFNWKGGTTSENLRIRRGLEYRLWREAVFARDNWTCQKTGVKGGRIVAHHIQNFAQYPQLRTSIENGITLSEESHQEFHKRYGIKNNTKEQLEEFFK